MNSKFLSKLRKPLRIILSVSIILAGLCLMWACLHIYRSGGSQPFSRESVAAAFRPIALPVYLCLGLTVVSFLAELLLPQTTKIKPLSRQVRMDLHRLQARTDLARCSEALRSEIQALRNDRKLYDRIGRTLLILSAVLFLTYGLNGHNFHPTQINRSMIRAMLWLIPCSTAPFLYSLFSARKNHASMVKELELLRSAPKESRITPSKPSGHHRRTRILRTSLLVVGLVILIYGIFAGGTADVLTKAVNICSECIGLG